jgi:hypothetical protein
MTVRELRAMLLEEDQDALVVVCQFDSDEGYDEWEATEVSKGRAPSTVTLA